ncbi:flagellar protein FlgN [Alkalibacillus haloalkaliphilus]|uniref:flagellar protein FlgN n=1 Tax=Alkalibacillus haloalkaliphilus TaxID=94136 RepID=UPI00293685B9|nr:flagellar protein FlgN [Alkalibacillus haloalkaliphilus]MDV2582843.1 flagellar protein FlgN [Alkalibacillus haloalkaliphilus]
MLIESIIEKLEKINQLNESLYQLSQDKTERLKNNDLEAFNELLIKERKHAQAIDQLEAKRVQETDAWFQQNRLSDQEQTITNMIEHIQDGEHKQRLETLYEKLVYVLANLKQQEQLNRELTQQSLQYLELTLDLIKPTYQKDLNYRKPQQQTNQTTDRSVFDSKA